jgi:hypothetical protein
MILLSYRISNFHSSSIELYENANNCLQFSGLMNIMCRSSVGFLNRRLISRKVWIYENINRYRAHIFVNREAFEPGILDFERYNTAFTVRTKYHNVRLQQGPLQFFHATYSDYTTLH